MKQIILNNQTAFLLYYEPNWSSPVDCSFSILSDTERGLTGKEDRTPTSNTIRASLSFDITTHSKTASEFRTALKILGNSPVLCPFWPAIDGYASSLKGGVSSGYWLVYEPDFSLWEIYLNGGSPALFTPSPSALKVPLLWGRFDSSPQPSAVTDETAPCSIAFIDNSPAELALTVIEQAFAPGPESDDMFPLLPNWAEEVQSGETSYEIVKDEIGFGRETADAYYDQDGARVTSQTFAAHGWNNIKKMIRFFYDKAGSVGRFWLPLAVSDTRLISTPSLLFPEVVTVSGCSDPLDNGDYVWDGEALWVKEDFYTILKTDLWYLSGHSFFYTAPDNGLDTPPDTFTRTLSYPATIEVIGTGTSADGVLSYNGVIEGRASYIKQVGDIVYGELLFQSPYTWLLQFGEYWEVTSYSDLPKKTGWSTGSLGSPAPTLVYSLIETVTVLLVADYGDQITVDDVTDMSGDDYIALIKGTSASGFEITGAVGDVLTLSPNLERNYTPSNTTISPLLLARFNENKLAMSFITDSLAVSDITCIEVPKEYNEIDSGSQGTRAYLYKFTMGILTWYFTSFERSITYNSASYISKPFNHSSVTDNINLERNEIEITSRRFWSDTVSLRNPLGYFLPLKLEAVLNLEVLECSPDAIGFASSATTVFKGQVSSASFDGPMITAKCSGISSLFDRKIPNILMQPTCNYALFSQPCGLISADWQMSSTVVSYSLGDYSIIVTAPSFTDSTPEQPRPAVTVFDHFFAGGKFESNVTKERRGILDSVANGSNIIITLRHPLEIDPDGGTTVYLWPGCDGKRETCKGFDDTIYMGYPVNPTGKFDNYKRFGGFPFIPLGNPTVSKVNKDYSQGGKK